MGISAAGMRGGSSIPTFVIKWTAVGRAPSHARLCLPIADAPASPIAFPAGVARMSIWRFCLYTFLGSLIWCWLLAWIGMKLGQHWDILGAWFHCFDAVILAILLIAAGLYVWRHVRATREE